MCYIFIQNSTCHSNKETSAAWYLLKEHSDSFAEWTSAGFCHQQACSSKSRKEQGFCIIQRRKLELKALHKDESLVTTTGDETFPPKLSDIITIESKWQKSKLKI